MATSASGSRESWIDLAKGSTILLVVLLHAQTVLVGGGWTSAGWAAAMDGLSTLRMPTFFLISGFFARKSLTVQPAVFRTKKLWTFLWVYALWSLIYIAPLELVGRVSGDQAFLREADRWIAGTFMVDGVLWYLVALPVFFLAARLLRRIPVPVQIVCAGALSFACSSSLINTGQWGLDRMAANFVYFLAGCYFSASIRSAAVRAGWRPAAILGLAWVGLSIVIYARPWPAIDAGFLPNLGQAVLPLLAVPFVLISAPLLARRTWANPLTWLGRNTLPIYVMHLAPISLIALAMQRTHLLVAGSWPTKLLPVILTVAAAGIILAVRPFLTHWVPWAFHLPAGIVRLEISRARVRPKHRLSDRRDSQLPGPDKMGNVYASRVRTPPTFTRPGCHSGGHPGRRSDHTRP